MTNAQSTITVKNTTAPATEAQTSYLNSLMAGRDNVVVCNHARYAIATQTLTKGLASQFISSLVASPKKVSVPSVASAFPETPAAPVADETPAYGYYLVNGTAYHFDNFKSKYYTQTKLMKLAVVTDHWTGKTKGKWSYAGGVFGAKKLLAGQKSMTQAEAGQYGLAHGFCIRCGRTLTDPHSVAKGIGPVCETYPGWWA